MQSENPSLNTQERLGQGVTRPCAPASPTLTAADRGATPTKSSRLRDKVMGLYYAVEQRIVPGLTYAQTQYEQVLDLQVAKGTRWLDLGCGHQVLPEWRSEKEREIVSRAGVVIGLDPDRDAVGKHQTIADIRIGSAGQLPFRDASFDLVSANMVLEHLEHPKRVFEEVARVLSPGGVFLIHTPNANGYSTMFARTLPHWACRIAARLIDGRPAEDVYPTFHRANSAARLRELAQDLFCDCKVMEICSSALFAHVLPLAILELTWIRITQLSPMHSLRSNLIGVFTKSAGAAKSS